MSKSRVRSQTSLIRQIELACDADPVCEKAVRFYVREIARRRPLVVRCGRKAADIDFHDDEAGAVLRIEWRHETVADDMPLDPWEQEDDEQSSSPSGPVASVDAYCRTVRELACNPEAARFLLGRTTH